VCLSSVLAHAQLCSGVVYLLPGPVDGGIGPRQEPFSFATGVSLLDHQTVNSPFVRLACTMISRDSQSLFHQYQPGCVGGPGRRSGGVSGCSSLGFRTIVPKV